MERKGYFYLALAILSFSTLEIVSKIIANDFNPFQLVFLRYFLCSIVLLPFAFMEIKKAHIKFSIKESLIIFSLGILIVVVSTSFFQFGLMYTKASIIAVIISSNPIFAAPLAYFILNEKIEKSVIISMILGILGMVVIASPYFSADSSNFIGILFGVGNTISFAAYNVITKKMMQKFGSLVVNTFAFISGSLALLLVLLWGNIPVFSGLNSSNIFHVLYLAIICSAVAYLCMFKGLKVLPVNRGSLVFFTKPVLAGILAFVILGETFTTSHIAGTVFILIGIMVNVLSGSKALKKNNAEKLEA